MTHTAQRRMAGGPVADGPPGHGRWIDSLHDRDKRVRILSMAMELSVLPNTFTTKTARSLGVHTRTLYALRDAGDIVELSRGVFRRADAPAASYPDLLTVSYRVRSAIVCCVSAAAVYELTDEIPISVQIAVRRRAHVPTIDYPPTRVFRFEETTFETGLSAIEAAPGEQIRVYDETRTVVDLMRLRHRLGEPLAFSCLNRYLSRRTAQPARLLAYAAALGVSGPMRRALDIASAA